MSNEIVKFSNQFNNVALRKFDSTHLDVLMSIASRVKERGTETVTFSFAELRELMRLRKNLTTKQLADKIVETNRRLLALNYMFTDDEGGIVQFALFTVFRTLPKSETLEVSVNPLFSFLLNDLTSQFTRFELAEFTGLKSRYAKEFYRRAKQFRSTGLWTVSREEFCRLLDVPKSTADSVSNLNRVVLKPIMEECGSLLGLEMHKKYERKPGQRGRGSLSGFIFMFRSEEPPKPESKKTAPTGVQARKTKDFSEVDVQRVMDALVSDVSDVTGMITARRRALTLLKAHGSVSKAVEAARLETASTDGMRPLF